MIYFFRTFDNSNYFLGPLGVRVIGILASHYWFHSSPWAYRNIHKKHHSFQYQVGWSAEIKTVKESILVSTTDLLPHLIFPCHLVHMLAWIVVGVIYNIEGHSGYSVFFIKRYGLLCYRWVEFHVMFW